MSKILIFVAYKNNFYYESYFYSSFILDVGSIVVR